MQYHCPFAVVAVGKSGEDIRFFHLLGGAFLVCAHILNDIPLLLRDQRGMRIFHNGAFAFGAVYRFVLFLYDIVVVRNPTVCPRYTLLSRIAVTVLPLHA